MEDSPHAAIRGDAVNTQKIDLLEARAGRHERLEVLIANSAEGRQEQFAELRTPPRQTSKTLHGHRQPQTVSHNTFQSIPA